MFKKFLAASTAALAMTFMVAAPADAAPRPRVASSGCTYTLDEAAGTLSGSCSTPAFKATFSGTYDGTTASGDFDMVTMWGTIDGSFTATGVGTSSMTGTWTVVTWFGTYSGTFSAGAV